MEQRSLANRMLALNTLAFTVCFAVWTTYGVLAAFLVDNHVLNIDKAQLGWLIGVPVLSGSLLRLPIGLASDRFGGKPVYIGVMLVGATSADNPEERVIIEGALDGGKKRKDAVIVSGSRFVMDGITMRNFSGNGVTVSKSTGVTLRNLVADKTGHYGVYPVESEDILVEGCTTSGIDDAGIYVGQSRRATVRGNHVFGNVAGIEIENTVTALVENNDVHDNTAGIMAFVLPNNPSKEGRDCTIRNNKTYRNNGKNFADPNAFVAKLPYGIGIGIMAADNTVVEKNEIYDNSSTGVALIGLQLFFTDPTKLDVEPNSDRARITGNTYRGNGKAPDPAYVNGAPVKLLGADVMWDSTGQGNCIDEPQGGELKTDGAAAALPRCK